MYRNFNNIQKLVKVEDILGNNFDRTSTIYTETIKKINERNFQMGVSSPTHFQFENIRYTWGVELETIDGEVPHSESKLLNLKTDFDGSLRGPDGSDPTGAEYVTGILTGDAGLKQLYNICKVLTKRCKIDRRCSVHIHIGNLDWGKEEVVYAYIAAMIIENQMFSTLPHSRRDNPYCRKLTPLFNIREVLSELRDAKKTSKTNYNYLIEKLYSKIFYEVSGGTVESPGCNSHTNHPKGSKCGFNKSSQRYCWMNFVTLIFNTRGNPEAKTLEIRSHSASLSYSKIKNWLKLWIGFCNFIDNNRDSMLLNLGKDLTISSIIKFSFPNTGEELIKYFRDRAELFRTSDETIDYIPESHDKKTLKEIICV